MEQERPTLVRAAIVSTRYLHAPVVAHNAQSYLDKSLAEECKPSGQALLQTLAEYILWQINANKDHLALALLVGCPFWAQITAHQLVDP